MDLGEVIRRRHMVRSFLPDPLPGPTVERILSSALRAPSAGNTSGWEAVVLEGPEQTAGFWHATTTPEWRTSSPRWPGLSRAPVVVVLLARPGAYLERYRESDKSGAGIGDGTNAWPVPYWHVDTGFAALLMLLSATEAGVAACFLGNFRGEDALREVLGVPRDRRYLGAVLLGKADGADFPSASSGRSKPGIDEKFHRGRWHAH